MLTHYVTKNGYGIVAFTNGERPEDSPAMCHWSFEAKRGVIFKSERLIKFFAYVGSREDRKSYFEEFFFEFRGLFVRQNNHYVQY